MCNSGRKHEFPLFGWGLAGLTVSVVVYGTYGTYGAVRYVRYEGLRSYHFSNLIFDLATYMNCSQTNAT
jgi:hypothetical protein